MKPLTRITPATVDVLTILLEEADSQTWGLEIVRRSFRPPGSVYPILERLERSGWVESGWEGDDARPGPRRRPSELTAEGATAARATVASFAAKAAPARSHGARPHSAQPHSARPIGTSA